MIIISRRSAGLQEVPMVPEFYPEILDAHVGARGNRRATARAGSECRRAQNGQRRLPAQLAAHAIDTVLLATGVARVVITRSSAGIRRIYPD